MISSGTSLLSTVDDSVVSVPNIGAGAYSHVQVISNGSAEGFIAFDGGANDSSWVLIPAGASGGSILIYGPILVTAAGVKIKRIAGGANMSGVQVIATPG